MTTYGDQRSDAQKAHDQEVKDRVERGIQLLYAKHGPDWVEKIDLDELQLSSGSACVLGQIYADEASGYEDGYDYASSAVFDDLNMSDFGFTIAGKIYRDDDWEQLQEAWEEALRPLKREPL